jgi:hypothetical protein
MEDFLPGDDFLPRTKAPQGSEARVMEGVSPTILEWGSELEWDFRWEMVQGSAPIPGSV